MREGRQHVKIILWRILVKNIRNGVTVWLAVGHYHTFMHSNPVLSEQFDSINIQHCDEYEYGRAEPCREIPLLFLFYIILPAVNPRCERFLFICLFFYVFFSNPFS